MQKPKRAIQKFTDPEKAAVLLVFCGVVILLTGISADNWEFIFTFLGFCYITLGFMQLRDLNVTWMKVSKSFMVGLWMGLGILGMISIIRFTRMFNSLISGG